MGRNNRTWVYALLCAVAACRSSAQPGAVPTAVFVPPAARQLRVTDGAAPGQRDVVYLIEEKYPAPRIREGLGRTLRDSGYQILDHDFLDPSGKPEPPRDWGSYVDAATRPETCVRELIEDWQNGRGDVVRYSLRYDSPCDSGRASRTEPTTDTVKVAVGVIPAETARALRDALSKAQRRQ